MEIIRTPRIISETSKVHLSRSLSIGFVPTMGVLHEGHLSLVRRARSENQVVIVSIFVNPIQFGPGEDFDRYPRDTETDAAKLEREGVDLLFMPDSTSVFRSGFSTFISVRDLSDKLCGALRPGHFVGVSTIVGKLFNMVKPVRAYFGQKDFQQSLIIKRMVDDLNMDIEVIICPIVRDSDGLAMSSRNVYLNYEERSAATLIYKTLKATSQFIGTGGTMPKAAKSYMHDMLRTEPLISEVQYASVYNPDTLDEISRFEEQALLAIALKIGNTRLIDNVLVRPN
ncbi:MAG: pantoate--beta-alanine ligase [Dissulfurispiraceae bacterium]